MDPILPQNDALISDYDAEQFGGDLGSEAIDNTWEGVPNLVIIDWSLNIGRFFFNLAAFKAYAEEYALEQGWEVGTTRSNVKLLYLHCKSLINCPFKVKVYIQAIVLRTLPYHASRYGKPRSGR